ncbi:hypothetical protein [Idiomarina fontislapidosi]|uniref:hypothetical protein n=1 Tax=Idiomarina fontislapidosi TaxID=263723 RepID=UPI000F873D2B|nr:hypothetical protein [Idiomarina fontislapidosi]
MGARDNPQRRAQCATYTPAVSSTGVACAFGARAASDVAHNARPTTAAVSTTGVTCALGARGDI